MATSNNKREASADTTWPHLPDWPYTQNNQIYLFTKYLYSPLQNSQSEATDCACTGLYDVKCHSFIHSRIYIAPLQGNYSEVLPTPARSKCHYERVFSISKTANNRIFPAFIAMKNDCFHQTSYREEDRHCMCPASVALKNDSFM